MISWRKALLEEVPLAGRRLGHFPTVGEWHVIRYDWRRCYICGLSGEGVDGEGGGGGMSADVMGSEGAAHASIRTGLTGKQAGLITQKGHQKT